MSSCPLLAGEPCGQACPALPSGLHPQLSAHLSDTPALMHVGTSEQTWDAVGMQVEL